ncbi:hypothetical protein LUZ60_005708 [Juncus effusus]|nr:hypothetical protein LUZ60_005708 [Juncus effusus]
MGSKFGASASPVPVCCMCGDEGLQQELLRCKACLFRFQHTYCSDLYPKVDSYRTCNWCLREKALKASDKEEANKDQVNSQYSLRNATNEGSGLKLNRGAFSSQQNKPIKKQRLLNRSVSDMTDIRKRSEEASPNAISKGRNPFRGRVRRYKLLEEVSS